MRGHIDAEDAAQEILIRVCKNIHTLSGPYAFGSWLDRIIINETRRASAKNSKRDDVFIFGEYMETVMEEHEEDCVELLPLEFAIREEDRRVVNEIIDTLPNRQREAVLLHYFDGLNVTETADAMEITKGKSSYYLKLACEKVKNEFSRRAGGQDAAAYGLGLLPVWPLLSYTLHLDEETFTLANDEWVKQAISKGTMAMKGKAGAAIGSGGFAVGWKLASILIALIAVGAVFLGASHGSINAASKMPISPNFATDIQGKVVLDGTGNGSYVNPGLAIAKGSTGDGDMTALDWWITAADSDIVLYHGEGGVVEGALTDLRENGVDGEYILNFRMADAAGGEYVLDCNFLISTG